jgi:hypothetical protein
MQVMSIAQTCVCCVMAILFCAAISPAPFMERPYRSTGIADSSTFFRREQTSNWPKEGGEV